MSRGRRSTTTESNPKLQAPNPNALPTPNSKRTAKVTPCEFAWDLAVGSALELGIWSLGFDEIAMKYRYSKFRPEDLDGLDLEELLSKLSDLLLSSGFDNPYGAPYDDEDGVSAEALHDAI